MIEFNAKPAPETAYVANRALLGVRDIASFDRPPIEALNAATGASINGDNFVYQKEQSGRRGGESKGSENQRRVFALPSNSFPAMFESGIIAREYEAATTDNAKVSPPFAAKAAQTYETNAVVINGASKSLGARVSMVL